MKVEDWDMTGARYKLAYPHKESNWEVSHKIKFMLTLQFHSLLFTLKIGNNIHLQQPPPELHENEGTEVFNGCICML